MNQRIYKPYHQYISEAEKLSDDDINYLKTKIEIDQNGNIDYKTFVEILTQ